MITKNSVSNFIMSTHLFVPLLNLRLRLQNFLWKHKVRLHFFDIIPKLTMSTYKLTDKFLFYKEKLPIFPQSLKQIVRLVAFDLCLQ